MILAHDPHLGVRLHVRPKQLLILAKVVFRLPKTQIDPINQVSLLAYGLVNLLVRPVRSVVQKISSDLAMLDHWRKPHKEIIGINEGSILHPIPRREKRIGISTATKMRSSIKEWRARLAVRLPMLLAVLRANERPHLRHNSHR